MTMKLIIPRFAFHRSSSKKVRLPIKMFSKNFVFFFVVGLFVFAAAEETAVDMFKEDIVKATEKAKEFSDHIVKMLGLDNIPAGTDLVEIIKTQAKNFADKAEQVQLQFSEELKHLTNSTIAEGFSQFNKRVLETVATFRNQIENSPATEKALELQGKFQDGITNLLQESKKVAVDIEPQAVKAVGELEKLTKQVLDEAVDSLKTLQDKIHTATGHSEH